MDSKVEQTHQNSDYLSPKPRRGVINKLYPPGPRPGVKGRMRNHCRKFWWCDLLVIVVVVLIIVLPIIFVGIPNKAQREINAASVEVTSQEVTDPQPDGVHLKLNTVTRSNSNYHPTIDGFRAALSLKGQAPFLHIDVPTFKAEGETSLSVDKEVKFDSVDEFSTYTKVVLASETFQVHLDGKTNIHLSGLPTMDVDFNQVITMKGLNKLSGLNLTDIRILTGPNEILADGSNLIGNITIPNPSVIALDLGDVTLDIAVDGQAVGYTLVPNLVLQPGDNTLPMQSVVNQLTILSLVQSKYKDAILPLEITGNSSVKNGQHLTYYEEAIKSNTINLDLNIGPALASLGIPVTGAGIA